MKIKAICFKLNHENGNPAQVSSLDEAQFEEFLTEIANRVYYTESSLPTSLLLDKLKAMILPEMIEGSLKELHAFTKEGLCAYRLPWPKGQIQEDGSEKVKIEDYTYKWRPPVTETMVTSKLDGLEAFEVVSWLIDDLIASCFK